MNVNLSLGSFNRLSAYQAMTEAVNLADNYFGVLSKEHAQICPQNHGLVSPQSVEGLQNAYPDTQFRLHANVQVLNKRIHTNLSTIDAHMEYWEQLIRVNQSMGSPVYSAHAGLRKECTVDQVFDNTRQLQDMMGSPVAIEGHYPAPGNPYLISSWTEYARLLTEGVYYALDLSHINILAHQSRRYDKTLIQELISNDRCLEVHVSGNNGISDSHIPITSDPIWINELQYKHTEAIVFIESTYTSKNTLTIA